MVPHGNLNMLLNINKLMDKINLPGSSSEREGLCECNELRDEGLGIGRSRALLNCQRDRSCIAEF
jgi:hypothetical protein